MARRKRQLSLGEDISDKRPRPDTNQDQNEELQRQSSPGEGTSNRRPLTESEQDQNEELQPQSSTSDEEQHDQQPYHRLCGQYGHSRSSFRGCPYYQPRPGTGRSAAPPENHQDPNEESQPQSSTSDEQQQEQQEQQEQPYHPLCGQYGHSRSSFRGCPHYQPRPCKGRAPPLPSSEPPPPPPGDEGEPEPLPPPQATGGKWVSEIRVYKTGLRKLLRTPNLENDIHTRVSLFTKWGFQASRFMQLHLQRVIENDLPFPDILNATWIRSVYSIVMNRQRFSVESDPDLVTTYDNHFQQPTTGYRLSPITGSFQMLTYFTQEYARNLKLCIKTHFESMGKRWVEHCLKLRGLPQTDARTMARLVWEYAIEDEEEEEGGDDEEGNDPLEMMPDDDEDLDQHQEHPAADPAFTRYMERIRSHKTTLGGRLRFMYHINDLFTRWECKLFSLVPLYAWEAKYITIDTNSLYYLLGGHAVLGVDIHTFSMNHQMHWQSHFQLSDALFPQEIESGRKIFRFMITTDGVGASVFLTRWKWVLTYDETPEQRETRLETARAEYSERQHAHVLRRTDTNDVEWIGVDPGRRSMITAAMLDDNDRWQWHMTSKHYHHNIKANERSMYRRNMARQHGIEEWQVNIPTFKSHCAAATVTALDYMFHGDFLSRALGVSLQRSTKHKRWRVYIHKQKTLTHVCQDLIGRRNPRNVVFAYGMGRFNASSRGYKPAPANQRWVTNRLTKGLHAIVININEYNTSQVCSHCFASRKLCAVGSNRDPFPAQPGSIQKSHFVRRCTVCRTIWNRDVNASRNMVYLALHKVYGLDRPALFSSRLAEAPIVRDEDIDNITSMIGAMNIE